MVKFRVNKIMGTRVRKSSGRQGGRDRVGVKQWEYCEGVEGLTRDVASKNGHTFLLGMSSVHYESRSDLQSLRRYP